MSLIVKLTDPKDKTEYYLDWSTMQDRPLTRGMSLHEFNKYYSLEYGRSGFRDLDVRLERVKAFGSSSSLEPLEYLLNYNRAGKNETSLDLEGLLNKYCR